MEAPGLIDHGKQIKYLTNRPNIANIRIETSRPGNTQKKGNNHYKIALTTHISTVITPWTCTK